MNIFLIDDDATFVYLTKRVIKSTEVAATIFEFPNGQQAIDYLVNNSHDSSLQPEIIFLDISMPVMDGWEFLEEYKVLPAAGSIPLYVFSSSISPHDVNKARSYSIVTEFLIKPITKEHFLKLFAALK